MQALFWVATGASRLRQHDRFRNMGDRIDALEDGEGAHMNTKRRGGGGPRRGRLGALLGAALVAVAGFSRTAATQELTTLHSFTGDDGQIPRPA